MGIAVVVTVFDDVGDKLLDGEIGGEDGFVGSLVGLEKNGDVLGERGSSPKSFWNAERDKSRHDRKVLLDAEDGSKFFTENQTGAEDADAEEAHGPDAEGAGDEAAVAEEVIEFVDGLGDGEVLLLLRENEAVADFEHGEAEGERPPAMRLAAMRGRVILRRERKGGQPRFWAASSRVHAGLLEPGGGAADDVGQAANAVGDDDDEERIDGGVHEPEELARLSHGRGNRRREQGPGRRGGA